MISDVLFDGSYAIEDYVRSGMYDEPEGPLHEAFVHLVGHMRAVQECIEYAVDEDAELDKIAREFGSVSSQRMADYVSRVTSPVEI